MNRPRKFAGGGGVGSFLKQKVNRNKTDHGVGLGVPMANLKKFRGFAGGGQAEVRKADKISIKRMPEREARRVVDEGSARYEANAAKADEADRDGFSTLELRAKYQPDAPVGGHYKDPLVKAAKAAREHAAGNATKTAKAVDAVTRGDTDYQYKRGGSVKAFAKGGNVSVPKKKLLNALMLAKQAGAQQAARPAPPAPGAGAPPPMGMKKGGFVPFGKKKDAGGDDKKEKWAPPWAKKAKGGVVKMAGGGMVGGRGDGCAVKGRTKGTMR